MIKRYNEFNESHKDIRSICKEYGITNYTINDDNSIDVNDDYVSLDSIKLTKLPLKFRNVSGDFYCSNNQLKTLEGCPITVGGVFHCNDNQLKNLLGSPKTVGGDFYCSENELVSLEGGPISVGGYFDCSSNELISLEGSPITVVGNFNCSYNQLVSLKGSPQSIDGSFDCRNNQLKSLEYISDFESELYFLANPIYKWWNMVKNKSKDNQDLFLDFNLHTDDPNEINLEKIMMINNH